MNAQTLRVPIVNDGDQAVELGLEPEGGCVLIPPGTTCEVIGEGPFEQSGFRIEFDGGLVSLWMNSVKSVEFTDGSQARR